MAFDTPATIAVLGAGPIGLEAALYARFLGYQVRIYERGEVAEHVRRWGHVRMFTPFAMNCSTLGRAALAAQDESYRAPDDARRLTGREWVDGYLYPLSQTDLLADELQLRTTVIAVSRWGATKGEWMGEEQREETPFRLLVCDAEGNERDETADIVIDTTGVYGRPKWLGSGGAPAVGERGLRDAIRYHVPDPLGAERERYAGRRTLLVGTGCSAATAAVAWTELAAADEGTRLVWVTRKPTAGQPGPLSRVPNDPIPARDALVRQANELLDSSPSWLTHQAGCSLRAVRREASGFVVRFADDGAGREWDEACDEIVALVGYRGDWDLLSELQVHLCYATEGPMKIAAQLLQQPTTDSPAAGGQGPVSLLNPEPHFYVLGSKSYGRNSTFLFSEGLRQIRDLFSIIGDRVDLDLYAGARSLPR